ncbi:SURP and G-patch domain-containing protein 2 isoform X1 [Ornithorhynchus anatinus]|uniref:SURP and G-patch domain-containing protein 2 isoform X1 n=1 Tax=Ornithorhynchus anatinus TaxID=9258 RepID=UPI0004541CC3|nr:SURP and G-patch domain-containing protein 2 isoform X1 [Ornithorhynchus anatinus]XP_007669027.1 SURP and G-patch domain-containing protein 2 isoform X1 [Ornithorhynchus anatinus]XP_007669028.1 SURP and G-patch domain-containing protein 2 isoform X1 [Ornithorhynchus anatinus]XP_016083581.1 SURP and G-patch domain-containing protein 2 isoform X1 [Ornithorhynchus anatinus]XP_028906332.1 SURP and G-patch domain-containing protein 2 isoform X1 [Ornithorhynchus anatinus]
MASRRITRETFDAVVQEKVKRYRMDHNDAMEDTVHQFKSQGHSRSLPRSRADRYEDSFHDDGRYSHEGSLHHTRGSWRDDPRDDEFPGPSFRSSSPRMSDDNYYHEDFGRPASRDRHFCRPSSRERDFGQFASRDWDFGHRDFGHLSSRDRDFGRPDSRDRDFGRPSSREPSWSREGDFGPSEMLGDFRSPGLLEDEYIDMESQDYDLEYSVESESEFQQPMHRGRGRGRGGIRVRGRGRGRGGVDQGRILQGKQMTRGALRAKVIKGDVRKVTNATLKKWNTKKVPPPTPLRVVQKFKLQRPRKPTVRSTVRPDLNPGAVQRNQPNQHPMRKAIPKPNQKMARPPRRELNFDQVDKSDIFSTFGMEIIKWARFHTIKDDLEFSQLFQTLFDLETETCAKMLASFKCSLKPEHRDFCFFSIKCLKHSALKTPKVDNEFLNMLLDKGAVKTKNCFFEIIKPFDKYMMKLQDRLLKSVTPLLMACNAYELSIKTKGFSNPAEMAGALETTNSLCRKSLALLGQTFSLASNFRQEKILEAVGLQEMAPVPTAFPNFDDSTLFGREYIENLKAWLEKSGYPIQMKKVETEPQEEAKKPVPPAKPKAKAEVPSDVPQRADRKVVEIIEKLVKTINEGTLTPKERAAQKKNPDFWFLSEEDSLEYKYYKLKLADMQRVKETPKGGDHKPTPEECAVRAMVYARKVKNLKKRLIPRKRLGLHANHGIGGWRMRKSTVGTQTLLSAGTMLKHQGKHAQGSFRAETSRAEINTSEKCSASSASRSHSSKGPDASGPSTAAAAEAVGISRPSQFDDVDGKTMETAEKLAKFVAQVGPEIEQFSIENSADNPDLWFLHDQKSSAFKFYRMKVYELCPSISFTPTPVTAKVGDGTKSDRNSDQEEEAEEEDELEFEEDPSQQEAEIEEMELGPEEEEEDDEEDEEAPSQEVSSKTEDIANASQSEGFTSEDAQNALSQPSSTSSHFPRKRISSKSLKVGMIPAPKRVCLIEEPKVHEPVRIAYDRPRGRPVPKKKQKPKDTEFAQQRLTSLNVGFQMLRKMGWKEGYGLGSRGKGIKEPVKLGTTSSGEGLGVEGQANKEDTFDVFRQRMIQMYRQKRASK